MSFPGWDQEKYESSDKSMRNVVKTHNNPWPLLFYSQLDSRIKERTFTIPQGYSDTNCLDGQALRTPTLTQSELSSTWTLSSALSRQHTRGKKGEGACRESAIRIDKPDTAPARNLFHHKYTWWLPRRQSGEEPACQCRRRKRHRFNPWVEKRPWRRKCNPLQYSSLENPMDRGAWRATVMGSQKSQTRQNTHTHTHTHTHTRYLCLNNFKAIF